MKVKVVSSQLWQSTLAVAPLYLSDLIGVTVGARPPVLQVSPSVLGALPGYPDAAASVGHAGAEVMDARGLVGSRQPPLIVLPLVRIVSLDVSDVMSGQFIYGSLKIFIFPVSVQKFI